MSSKFENKIILSGGVHDLQKYNNQAMIVVKSDTVVNAINLHNNMDLHFCLEKGAHLTFNVFDFAVNLDTHLVVEAKDGASFIINAAFIAEVKYALDVDVRLYGDDIDGALHVRGVNEREGTVKIIMNGTVAGETKGNVLNEYARILNKSTLSNVLIPNLVVNTNEVEANHGVSVGYIREDELFYLMSKGITREVATKLIEEGFIMEGLDDANKQKIQNILVGR